MRNFTWHSGLYLLVLALLLINTRLAAQKKRSPLKSKRIALKLINVPPDTLIRQLILKTGIPISATFRHRPLFNVDEESVTLLQILEKKFRPRGYTWRINKGRVPEVILQEPDTLLPDPDAVAAVAPNRTASAVITVSGFVTMETREPLPGATVKVMGTGAGTKTNAAGRFTLPVNQWPATLEVSYMGFETQQIPLNGQRIITVLLKSSGRDLNSVYVLGYGKGSKRLETGAVQYIAPTHVQQMGTSDALATFQGQVPNLLIEQTTGMPGGAISVQMRGRSSIINRAGPMYVVDGIPYVPMSQTANLLLSISSQNLYGGVSPFCLQMFGQIESILVLKDAAATAIYGSRGANGVIIITTVRGKVGRPGVEVSLVRGFGAVASKYDLLSATQYRNMRQQAFANDGLVPGNIPGLPNYAPDLTVWDSTKHTDWQEKLLGKTAHITDLNIAFNFGTEQTRLRLDGSLYRETAVTGDDMLFGRTGFNFSVDHTTKNGRFQLAGKVSYSTDHQNSYVGSAKAAFTVENADAAFDSNGVPLWQDGAEHPYAERLKEYYFAKKNYQFSLIPKWRPWTNLLFKTSLAVSGLATNESDRHPIASQNPWLTPNRVGSTTQAGKKILGYLIEPVTEYNPNLPGELTVVAGGSYQRTFNSIRIVTGEGFSNDNNLVLEKAPYFTNLIYQPTDYLYTALFGQVKYNWYNKYLATISFRRDASSQFGPDNNSGYFWAISAGWIFSELAAIKNRLPLLHFGKLRGSVGLTGSDQVADNQTQAVWSTNPGNNPYQGIQGLIPRSPYNPGFSWERCLKRELALDFELLRGRIEGGISYYHNKSYNQLLQTELPAQTGFPAMLRNHNAEIWNYGFEMVLMAHVIQSGQLHLQVAANVALPRNKLHAFDSLDKSPYAGVLLLNEPVTVLNKLQSGGVGPTGRYVFKDRDGKPGYTVADYTSIGSTDPTLLAGMELTLTWKYVRLGLKLDYRKQKGFSYLYPMLMSDLYPGGLSNQSTAVDYWQREGDAASFQKVSATPGGEINSNKSLILISDLAYASTSYLKGREVTCAVDLPEQILSKLRCRQASFFIIGRNLFTITPYKGGDPEVGNVLSLSTLRSFSLGFKFSY
ncbi:SusC/RagA family TonB-linked outer membrane protein [Chitinophaga sp. S165]|uniref:SusC/RagA family TonB-linked outer membrane protein n=1 Tax=Chitinophaga sp. S165 TaxID=2135462 RepID=UPI000D70DC20|nr:SusC/RagA family TonB-linked outer membrane protein [Chitinophaga sp. S165]PWV55555.1 TonB-linked SusC/RagA family outer membrane protein [Chitinophaga sp. S165]